MKRAMVLCVVILAGGLMIAAAGLQAPPGGQGRGASQSPTVAQIERVKENLYMITGGGGNTAAFITDSGVVVVDTKNAGWGQAILDKIRTVTSKPVTMIINTHTHGDHVGSNEFFGATVEVVAHENTKTNMERMDGFKGEKTKFLPRTTFKDKRTVLQGKDEIDLYYFGPGHTSGDAWVVFKALRAMHAGDMFSGKNTPIIDTGNGGSAVNYGKTLAAAASTIQDVDMIITGHSTVMTPADLREYADFNNDFVSWVQSEIKAGKSVDEAAAEFKIPAKYQGYTVGGFMGGIKGNIQTAYNELTR